MRSALALATLLVAGAALAAPPVPPAVPPPPAPEVKAPPISVAGAEPAAKVASPPGLSAQDPGALPRSPQAVMPGADKAPAEGDDTQARKVLPNKPSVEPRSEKPVEGAVPSRTYAIIPPALSSRALLDELRHTSKDRQAEQTGMAQQTQKLQAMQQDIEQARAALREETTRLQALVSANEGRTRGGKASDRKATGKGSQQPESTPIDNLAKTARNMKPDQAAEMMTRLDRGLATAILTHMKPADAALVLEKMEPATSAALVALLARKDRT